MPIKLYSNVRHNGKEYLDGDIISDINSEDEQRLINLGVAFFIGNNETIIEVKDSNHDEDTVELLDVNFTLEELKEELDELKIKYPKSMTKSKLIDWIMKEKNEQHFLDMLED